MWTDICHPSVLPVLERKGLNLPFSLDKTSFFLFVYEVVMQCRGILERRILHLFTITPIFKVFKRRCRATRTRAFVIHLHRQGPILSVWPDPNSWKFLYVTMLFVSSRSFCFCWCHANHGNRQIVHRTSHC